MPTYTEDGIERLPVVLIHGMCSRDYSIYDSPLWGRIPDYLRHQGNPGYFTNQDAWGDLEHNGRQIEDAFLSILRETKSDKVHIIAHSKGGLDAYHITHLPDILEHVASVTTLGCPNKGIKMCDFLVKIPFVMTHIVNPIIKASAKRHGDIAPNPIKVLEELSTKNRTIDPRDFSLIPGIEYRTYAFLPNPTGFQKIDLRKWFIYLFDGPNDGIVPIWSTEGKNWIIVHSEKGKRFNHDDCYDLNRRDVKLTLLNGKTYKNTPELICSIVDTLDRKYAKRISENPICCLGKQY